jgi:hypothetical protein
VVEASANMKARHLLVAMATWAACSHALALSPFDSFMATAVGASQTTVGFGSNGMALATTSPVGTLPANTAGSMAITHAAGGWPSASGTASVPSPIPGKSVPVSITAPIAKSSAAKAIGKAAFGMLPGISNAIALGLFVVEMGKIWKGQGDIDSPPPGYNYSNGTALFHTNGNGVNTFPHSSNSPEGVCAGVQADWTAAGGLETILWDGSAVSGTSVGDCRMKRNGIDTTYASGAAVASVKTQTPCASGVAYSTTTGVCTPNAPPSTDLTEQQFIDEIAAKSGWPSSSNVSKALAEAAKAGYAADAAATDPANATAQQPSVSSDPKVTTNSDGSTKTQQTTCGVTTTTTGTVTTSTPVVNFVCSDQTTTMTPTVTTKPDGTTQTSTVTTTTTTTNSPPKASDAPICGVTGFPPCNVKVDETGMPTADDMKTTGGKDTLKDIGDLAANPTAKLPAHPVINWAFLLPAGCAAIPTPAFAPFLSSIDVCQFQPMFHDVMSMVWLLGGIFGAIQLFMRNALAD